LFRAENLPLFRLGALLGQQHKLDFSKNPIGLVFRNSGKPFAVLVDDVIGQQPVVMKELSDGMGFSQGFSGTTILGDGKAALILEISELVNVFGKRAVSGMPMRGTA